MAASIQSVLPITLQVSPTEPCFRLSEINLQAGHGWHRYQILTVVRADRLARHHVDLGPRELFPCEEFHLIGGFITDDGKIEIVHTVDELRDTALQLRARPKPNHPVPDLWRRFQDALQSSWDWRKRLVVSGPFITRSKSNGG